MGLKLKKVFSRQKVTELAATMGWTEDEKCAVFFVLGTDELTDKERNYFAQNFRLFPDQIVTAYNKAKQFVPPPAERKEHQKVLSALRGVLPKNVL